MMVGIDNVVLVFFFVMLGGVFMFCMDMLVWMFLGGEVLVGIFIDIVGVVCFGMFLFCSS